MSRWLIILCLIAQSAYATNVKVGVTEWYGYTNTDGTGKYFELLNAIYGQENLDLQFDSFQRMKHFFENGKSDMVIGIFREEINSAHFPKWHLDIEYPAQAFYKKENFSGKHISDFYGKTFTWVRGYQFGTFLNIKHSQYLVNDIYDGFKLLVNNRTDVFIDYDYNLPDQYKKQFSSFEILPEKKMYVAFAKTKRGFQLAEQFDQKMLELRDRGELKKIFKEEYARTGFADFNPNTQKIILRSRDIHLLQPAYPSLDMSLESKILSLILPEIQSVEFEVAKYSRFDNDIKNYKNAEHTCLVNKVKTSEREQHFLFSKPFVMYSGTRLFSTVELKQNKKTAINLAELMTQNPQLKIGVANGQFYPQMIQQQLDNIKQNQIVDVQTNILLQLKSLSQNEFQLKLEYPALIDNHWSQVSQKKLYSYPVVGTENYTLGHLMCSKSESTQGFINKFNQVLDKVYEDKVFNGLHRKSTIGWDNNTFDRNFKQAFKAGALKNQ